MGLNFVKGVSQKVLSHLHEEGQFSHYHLLKRVSFLQGVISAYSQVQTSFWDFSAVALIRMCLFVAVSDC